jgi:Delta24-sterol reductase
MHAACAQATHTAFYTADSRRDVERGDRYAMKQMEPALERHHAKVRAISEQVKARPPGRKISIRKATPTHQIHDLSWKDECYRVDVSRLDEILEFRNGTDRLGLDCSVAICEGQVEMGKLATATLAHGLVPQVVPEYTNFTVAGLISGEGIQTSAFKYGVFSHTVVMMEVVLGNGEVVECDATTNRELFIAMPESCGTLGIVTLAAVALRPATPWVKSVYLHYSSLSQFVLAYQDMVKARAGDFLEGLVARPNTYLIIQSEFVDSADGLPVYHPEPEDTSHGEPYYYQYLLQQVLRHGAVAIKEDLIPTWEFLFRSMRGVWWMIECYINWSFLTNRRFFRRIIDKKTANIGFENRSKLSRRDLERCFVLQDMGIRLSRLEEGIAWVERRLGVYPLWICATDPRRSLKYTKDYRVINPDFARGMEEIKEEWIVDIGIYGEPSVQPFQHFRVLAELQHFVDCPSVWGTAYNENPDALRERYRPLRQRWHAYDAFPGLEEKIVAHNMKDANLNEGPIPSWRFVRDHGPHWKLKFASIFVACIFALLGVCFVVYRN